jgi:hypothetical protein
MIRPSFPANAQTNTQMWPESKVPANVKVPAIHLLPEPRTSHSAHVAVVGNHLPRQCGVATFTTDLCNAITA